MGCLLACAAKSTSPRIKTSGATENSRTRNDRMWHNDSQLENTFCAGQDKALQVVHQKNMRPSVTSEKIDGIGSICDVGQ